MSQLAYSGHDRLHGIVDDRERLEAQEIDLEHSCVLEAFHVVLCDMHGLGGVSVRAVLARLDADRHVVVQRARRDYDAGGVYRRVPGQAFERHGVVEELLVSAALLV